MDLHDLFGHFLGGDQLFYLSIHLYAFNGQGKKKEEEEEENIWLKNWPFAKVFQEAPHLGDLLTIKGTATKRL